MYACLYRPPHVEADAALAALAEDFSPRFESHGADLVVVDVGGLERLIGPPRVIGDELVRTATARGLRLHIALARTQTTAIVLARTRPGLTVVPPGGDAEALAPVALGILGELKPFASPQPATPMNDVPLATFAKWGLRTLGDLAALPAADLVSRLGRAALAWQAMAVGEDRRPLVPTLAEERFDGTLELEWPIEGLEPLSFVLTRLLEPLSIRLEKRDRGAAVLHVLLRLTTREMCSRRLELPTPMRDVRALRTLALLDLESHPPGGAIDAVTIAIDPTPGRVVQHQLFTRAHPTPEQLSTLLARLGAVMGQDRVGAPAEVDTYRPGAFAMTAFRTEHEAGGAGRAGRAGGAGGRGHGEEEETSFVSHLPHQPYPPDLPPSFVQALRRCRQPVPARVVVAAGRPVRVTTDRRGYTGGTVVQCAGPWRTSGEWWNVMERAGQAGETGRAGRAGEMARAVQPVQPIPPILPAWNRDEWDVSLSDGAMYRIFQDRESEAWFIEGIVD